MSEYMNSINKLAKGDNAGFISDVKEYMAETLAEHPEFQNVQNDMEFYSSDLDNKES